MYKKILVATGGSPWSEAAVAYAIAMAARTGAALRILNVLINPGAYISPDVIGGNDMLVEVIERQGQELLEHAASQAASASVVYETICRWGGIAETILQTAVEEQCDLIVLGARMVTGWKRLRLGHIANAVAAKAIQPVLIVKQPPAVEPGSPLGRRVLVATGGSPWSDFAVEHAITLAQSQRLAICLLHVLPRRSRRSAMDDTEGRAILARAETQVAAAGVSTTTVLARGDAPSVIVETAEQQQCDGIILGSRGLTGLKRLMLGSISNAVAVKTALPVLVVKRF